MNYSTVYEYLKHHAAARPEAAAILTPGKKPISYSALFENVEQVRLQLGAVGIEPGSNVGLVFPSRDVMAVALLAVGSCATAVPFAITDLEELDNSILERFHVSAILVEGFTGWSLPNLMEETPVFHAEPDSNYAGLFELDMSTPEPVKSVSTSQPEDAFVLLETSGITGAPKIVPVTHRSIITASRLMVDALDLGTKDRCLNVLLMNHSAGVNELIRVVVAGASIVQANFDPAFYVKQVVDYEITWFNLVPSMHRAVLPFAKKRISDLEESCLRVIRSGAAELSPSLRDELETTWGVAVIDAYGSTESGTLSIDPGPGNRRSLSVGLAVPAIVSIRNRDGEVVPNGQIGEIWATGPSVFPGYLNDSETNAEIFRDDWLRMGDTGYLDDDGFLYLEGRATEAINRGGETIAPGEIENIIADLDGVEQCVVFGVAHERLGEELWAAVKLSPGTQTDARTIRSDLAKILTFAKTPKQILLLDQIPHNSVGKVDRGELRRKYSSGMP